MPAVAQRGSTGENAADSTESVCPARAAAGSQPGTGSRPRPAPRWACALTYKLAKHAASLDVGQARRTIGRPRHNDRRVAMHAQRCESCARRRCRWRRAERAADGVRAFGRAPALWKPCPCTVLVHSPDFGFQTLRLASPSPPPVTTRLPSGVKAPQVTGPWCPVSTCRRPRRPTASQGSGVQ